MAAPSIYNFALTTPLCGIMQRAVSSRSDNCIEGSALGGLGDGLPTFAVSSCLHDLNTGARAPQPCKGRMKKVLRFRTRIRIVDNEESSAQ